MWLCPKCEANSITCQICDGDGFLSDREFQHYEKVTKPNSAVENGLLILDLSEFESE